ncbi:hypothetical protein PDESU_03844 [Pontiella desulfatans]|uniref:Uncharacterized protein n=1 Tax=Pontiella desulfatans TaxID=2750659 RepID=A0A6C2U5C2_PONDE|nr:hypothetical protein [Pontiella desulfatans]VGO15262.1 hypothetical protein PDESU_03844 [Pontiella desulfatans]
MTHKTISTYQLAPMSFGAPCTYELSGDHIVGRLFGIIPYLRIHLGAVHYLRLATRSEVSPVYFIFNWPQFLLTNRRSVSPVYILQTRKGHRICLKLAGGAHFKLRQAIARHSDRKRHRMAA